MTEAHVQSHIHVHQQSCNGPSPHWAWRGLVLWDVIEI